MKPFLDHAAAAEPFRPEMARRLGLRAFTADLDLTSSGIAEFMTHPRQFLRDVYEQLGPDQQAGLALVYAAAVDGSLESPLALTEAQRDTIERAGSTPAGAARALQALTGTFLQETGPPLAQPGWAFRHPTLWEGFAAWVSSQPHLLTVLLAGITDSALLTRVDCENENADQSHGTLLRVPPALYPAVAERLAAIRQETFTGRRFEWDGSIGRQTDAFFHYSARQRGVLGFLSRRSCDAFLKTYLAADPDLPVSLVSFTSYVSVVPEPAVLARLRQAGLLAEQVRLQAIERMAHLAVETPDDGWLATTNWQILLTPADRAMLMDKVRAELIPRLETLDGIGDGERDADDDPIERALFGYERAFENEEDFDAAQAFTDARETYSQRAARDRDYGDYQESRSLASARLAPPPDTSRSIFDDVDEQ